MKLIRMAAGRYTAVSDNLYALGTLAQVKKSLVSDSGMDPEEVEIAVDEMEKNRHNVACFGIYGDFLFTEYCLITEDVAAA